MDNELKVDDAAVRPSDSKRRRTQELCIRLSADVFKHEAALFHAWVNASIVEMKYIFLGHDNAEEMVRARKEFFRLLDEIECVGFSYDPTTRQFIQFDKYIDTQPRNWNFDATHRLFTGASLRPSRSLCFVYRPMRHKLSQTAKPSRKCQQLYGLRVLHPKTQQFKQTTVCLEDALPRRFYNAKLQTMVVLYSGVSANKVVCRDDNVHVSYTALGQITGTHVNKAIWKLWQTGMPDLVVFALGNTETLVDNFVPVFPMILSKTVIACTPIHLKQMNGVHMTRVGADEVIASLIERITTCLGAAVMSSDVSDMSLNILRQPLDVHWYKSGVSCFKQGIFQDGRVNNIQQRVCTHVPLWKHGWLSRDTKAMLVAAIQAFKPKNILELGSWYGLSASLIQNYAPNAVLYAVDHFKNNAIYTHSMSKLSALDKMFFNHLRYETFHANLEENSIGNVIMMKMDAYEAVRFLKSHNVTIDMVFIDCEKKTKPLQKLIHTLRSFFPGVIIVGDDYVFRSVRAAIAKFSNSERLQPVLSDEAYAILTEPKKRDILDDAFRAVRTDLQSSDNGSLLKQIQSVLSSGVQFDPSHVMRDILKYQRKYFPQRSLISIPAHQADSLLHMLCRCRNKQFISSCLDLLFDATTWQDGCSNTQALTPFDYLCYKITFE